MVFRYVGPRQSVQQLRQEMDRVLSGFLGAGPLGILTDHVHPAANVFECGDTLGVELELPGVKSDQVDIAVVGNELSIKVDRPEVEQKGVTYHRRERPVGSFTRIVRLPVDVDADKVAAELQNGVLLIKLPKAENARPRKIQVKTTS